MHRPAAHGSRPVPLAVACLLLVLRWGTQALSSQPPPACCRRLSCCWCHARAISRTTCLRLPPQVRSLAPLSSLGSTQLTELYAACNKITAIESLEQLGQLQALELGGNRIRVLQGKPWLAVGLLAWLPACLRCLCTPVALLARFLHARLPASALALACRQRVQVLS